MRARKPTYGHLLFRIYERLDAIEQRLSALSAEQLSENEEILDTRKMRLLSKMSDRTLLRRRNDCLISAEEAKSTMSNRRFCGLSKNMSRTNTGKHK